MEFSPVQRKIILALGGALGLVVLILLVMRAWPDVRAENFTALARARWQFTLVPLLLLLGWETVSPLFPFFQGRRDERLRHGARNVFLGVLNAALAALLFAGLWWVAAEWAERHRCGLLHLVALPPWARVLGAIVLLDAWLYWWHRLNHRVPFLWRFHRVHHSDARMDVTTASRFHLGEVVLSHALRIPVILLLGARAWEMVLYETLLFAVVQFHHANIGLPEWLDRPLRCLVVTPAIHKVHHSRLRPETDSNYSSLCSVWDRLFRSLRLRAHPREIQFGLEAFDAPPHQTVPGLLKTPLEKDRRPGTEG